MNEMLFGSCAVAAQVERGEVRSSTSAETWHAECPGAVVGLAGLASRCTCPCHPTDTEPLDLRSVCVNCGDERTAIPKEMVDGRRVCASRPQECEERRAKKAEENPHFAAILASRTQAELLRTEEKVEEAKKPAGTKRKGGRCEHCGQLTAGGRFAPGHDAKLKSELHEQVKAGGPSADAEAYAELLVRKWPVPWAHDDTIDLATAISQADDVGQWLLDRCAARQERSAQ